MQRRVSHACNAATAARTHVGRFLVRIKGDQPTVKFTDIVPKDVGRYVAAAAFQNVLCMWTEKRARGTQGWGGSAKVSARFSCLYLAVLATRNLLQPAQARPFGPISIRTL